MVMNRRPPPKPPPLNYDFVSRQMMATYYSEYMTYPADDPRYVSPMHMNEEGAKRAGEVARKKREEREAEEARNMKMWGRKDDPRLDPTSEFFDPLKLIHKDVEDGD